ncbi:MAG TPA: LysR substrate-binding domain-containing protein [Steroidobacteraceae bacterium]|jgi:DNA-binding transcriptional LysR family regulator
MIRRLPLGSLRVFVSVAERLNFTRAAEALGVTASAASLQIRVLEEYLGRSLLRRDGRHVRLTEEGAALLPRVRRALEDLEAAIDDARGDRGSGILRVSMLASFLQQWLLPRMPRFQAAHPAVKLYVHTSIDLVDFVHSDHQVAIRMGREPRWPGVESEKLLEEWLVPVCAPSLLRKHGPIDNWRDLQRYPLLHSESEPWSLWRARDAEEQGHADPKAQFDDSTVIVRLAARGEGLALARWSLVADEVGEGTLALACRTPVPYGYSYWFVYPRRARSLASVTAFKAWMFAEAARFPEPT